MRSPDSASLLDLVTAAADTDAVGETILDAALAEMLDFGLRRTNVEVVAKRAGVSRATVYRRFVTKDALVQAVLVRESRRFYTEIAEAVAALPTVAERLVEGFVVGVRHARTEPLMNRLLATDPDALLPYLTTHGYAVVAASRDFLVWQGEQVAGKLQPVENRDPAGIAEIFVRLAISFTLTPRTCIPFDSDEDVRRFATSYLAVLMRESDA